MNIIVEHLKSVDVKEIVNINKNCLPVVYNQKEYIEFILDKDTILLKAVLENNTIGYVLGKWYSNVRFHIMSFGVNIKFRRHNVGTKLIEQVINKAKESTNNKLNIVTLYVQVSNISAINFYEKCGFIKQKYMKNFYNLSKECLDIFLLNSNYVDKETIKYFLSQDGFLMIKNVHIK